MPIGNPSPANHPRQRAVERRSPETLYLKNIVPRQLMRAGLPTHWHKSGRIDKRKDPIVVQFAPLEGACPRAP
jgi:hypothetical protein